MKTICYRCCELLSVFFSGLLDRFFSLCAAVCLADVSVFVAAVSVLVLAVSTFVLLYDMCVCVCAVSVVLAAVSLRAFSCCVGLFSYSIGVLSLLCWFCPEARRSLLWWVGGLMRDVTREVLA